MKCKLVMIATALACSNVSYAMGGRTPLPENIGGDYRLKTANVRFCPEYLSAVSFEDGVGLGRDYSLKYAREKTLEEMSGIRKVNRGFKQKCERDRWGAINCKSFEQKAFATAEGFAFEVWQKYRVDRSTVYIMRPRYEFVPSKYPIEVRYWEFVGDLDSPDASGKLGAPACVYKKM